MNPRLHKPNPSIERGRLSSAPHVKRFGLNMSIRLFLVLAVVGSNAFAAACVLPEADGQGPNPSPASVEGVIASISSDHLVLIPKSHPKRKLQFRITERTSIFTADGGLVQPNELDVGQHASIWTEHCVPVSSKQFRNAAIVQVCSTAPVPCGWSGKAQPIIPPDLSRQAAPAR